MPTFRTISIAEARANTATGKRAALLCMGYVQCVPPGEAGVLETVEGENHPRDPAQARRGGGRC